MFFIFAVMDVMTNRKAALAPQISNEKSMRQHRDFESKTAERLEETKIIDQILENNY